ncbi:MAG: hypothetical protein ACLPX7_00860 [Xanthobacteraceae bacterium]
MLAAEGAYWFHARWNNAPLRAIVQGMGEELSLRCEARRRDHGGWMYWIYQEDDPHESSRESYGSEHEALLAGYERMDELKRRHASAKGHR